jgi:hypothetical protein
VPLARCWAPQGFAFCLPPAQFPGQVTTPVGSVAGSGKGGEAIGAERRLALAGFCGVTMLAFAWPETPIAAGVSLRLARRAGCPTGAAEASRAAAARRHPATTLPLQGANQRAGSLLQEPPGGGEWGCHQMAPGAACGSRGAYHRHAVAPAKPPSRGTAFWGRFF